VIESVRISSVSEIDPHFQTVFNSNLVSSVSDNPKCLWQTVNNLLHSKSSSSLPTSTLASSVADNFANFFTDKFPNFIQITAGIQGLLVKCGIAECGK